MMIFQTAAPHIYYALLLSVLILALKYGNRDELIGALILLAGSVFTTISAQYLEADWTGLFTAIFCVDAMMLVALTGLAVTSDRFWPIWATAFHLVATSIHLAAEVSSNLPQWALATGTAFWAYPMIVVLGLGIRESRNRRDGGEQKPSN